MSQSSRKQRSFDHAIEHLIADRQSDSFCREDNCERLDVHKPGPGNCIKRRGGESLYRTRSKRFPGQPWRAYCQEALRESAYAATSGSEPRNFATILGIVENDYGSCCDRSLHRQLLQLRDGGRIVRLDFRGKIHAYLRAGSRLINEPALVLEQILDLQANDWYEAGFHNRSRKPYLGSVDSDLSVKHGRSAPPSLEDVYELPAA